MAKTAKVTCVKRFPCLYKRTSGGGTQIWLICVETCSKGTDAGVLAVTYGLKDGKQQIKREAITKGKNEGRKNATTPMQQALAEAQARWTKQLERKGYGRTVEQSADTRSLSPMLALALEKVKEIDWSSSFAQPKLDGFRLRASKPKEGKIILKSRENKPITTLHHLEESLNSVMQVGDEFDGEAYSHELPFQKIASAIKKRGPLTDKIVYHLYDLIADKPFKTRSEMLKERLSAGGDCLEAVKTVMVRSRDELMLFQSNCIEEGFEGAMLRHGKKGYEAGKRSNSLVKVKTFDDAEFEIVDVRCGRGTHQDVAIFICETPEGNHFEVTAPGTMEQKKQIWKESEQATNLKVKDHPYVGTKLTVKFQGMTTGEEPVPRFPVALRAQTEPVPTGKDEE